jgi:protein required for attachment to host cells
MAQLRIANGDWVLVGDGQKALLLQNHGDAGLLDLRRLSVRSNDNPSTAEQGTDKPGRSFSSASQGRSSYEGTDWHALGETRFATELAAEINRAAQAHEFKKLVVVAPPKALGDLRSEFSQEAQKRISAEINKDLTNHTIPEIEKLLQSYEV